MDVMDEDVLALWSKLNQNNVAYIMIGGFATNLHGFQRFTGDLDIWILDTKTNRKALRKAIHEYGLPDMEEIERLEFISGWTGITLLNFFTLDVLTEVKGLENIPFDECLQFAYFRFCPLLLS